MGEKSHGAAEGRELFSQREDREKGGECNALGSPKKSTPPKVAEERKSENTCREPDKKSVPQTY